MGFKFEKDFVPNRKDYSITVNNIYVHYYIFQLFCTLLHIS